MECVEIPGKSAKSKRGRQTVPDQWSDSKKPKHKQSEEDSEEEIGGDVVKDENPNQ